MKLKLVLIASIAALSSPAYAGSVAPSPEVGAGLAAMAVVVAGYAFLRRRAAR